MSADEIRRRFTKYFVGKGHAALASGPIVPESDRTLLFTAAGMVPFKQQFMQPATAVHKMVTTVQKCVRAGGKHNDLDQVGHTARHHTFFEMLGNFSFGAYDKRAAIRMAWQFVREELRMPEHMLRVTVLESDDETYGIWRDEIGLDPRRVVRCGPEDNFWSMGAADGPCGPCTELFWDTGDPRYAEDDGRRWLEFWNLVFMQFRRGADGALSPLATPCIDTGMGLERVAAIMQGRASNFDTDEFRAIIDGIDGLPRAGAPPGGADAAGRALAWKRIIADHLRASAFLVSEGVRPSNTGRGYVLRRIIRRAARAGRMLGVDGPVLAGLYPRLEAAMSGAYPELAERRGPIVAALQAEERVFGRALGRGMAVLEGIVGAAAAGTVSGADAFALYDTHGFPVDLTQLIARDSGWAVDVAAFERIQAASRQKSRASWRGAEGGAGDQIAGEIARAVAEWQAAGVGARFCGYDADPEAREAAAPVDARVVAFRALGDGSGVAVVDPCPFYALGGGQDADTGTLAAAGGSGPALAVRRAVALPGGRAAALHVTAGAGPCALGVGQRVAAAVDAERRRGCAVHHTATHLLHAALRRVLGAGAAQAGSLVRADGLRFDFAGAAPTDRQIREIERAVNDAALRNAAVRVCETTLAEARARGATALFTEKYDPACVRVVEVPGVSLELCSGTHLRATRGVFPFQIVSEGSIGAGTRRIEAVAGAAGAAWLQRLAAHTRDAARALGAAAPADLPARAERLAERSRALARDADEWLRVAAADGATAVATRATALGATRTPAIIHLLPPGEHSTPDAADARLAAERARWLSDAQPHAAHAVVRGRAVAVAVSPAGLPGVAAAALLRDLLRAVPGRGGGQGAVAQGRLDSAVTDIAQLPL